ncbi:MAG: hypothetical protein ABI671_09950 [Burkholderiales bacterium]
MQHGLRWVGVALVVSATVTVSPARAAEDAAAFDGRWDVTLSCASHHEDEDAKGYVHRFPAEVSGGVLRGTHGTEGEPGWHLLTGRIAADGRAALKLEGIVNNAEYAVGHAFRGKPYTYRVRAAFEGASGRGQRIGKRQCDFLFQRR